MRKAKRGILISLIAALNFYRESEYPAFFRSGVPNPAVRRMHLIVLTAGVSNGCLAKGLERAAIVRAGIAALELRSGGRRIGGHEGSVGIWKCVEEFAIAELVCTIDYTFWSASKAYTQQPMMESRVQQKADEEPWRRFLSTDFK